MAKVTAHVVLDRSGSMQSIRDEAIGAFNAYVETLAAESPKSLISLTLFDSTSIDTILDSVPASMVAPLTTEDFVPRGMTPLYDAIGKVAADLTEADGKLKALVILTDGQENNSREFKASTIKALLEEKQDKDNWLVIYLGANQDAFAEGGLIGTRSANTMDFAPQNLAKGLAGAARSTVAYTQSMDTGFTDAERSAAK